MNNEEEIKKEDRHNIKAKQVTLYVIVVFLLLLLLFLGLGFFAYENYKYNNPDIEPAKEEEKAPVVENEYEFDISDNNVVTTRLIAIMGVLNNPYLEKNDDIIGYIYKNGHNDIHTISNEYIIYTALNYLKNRNELEDNDDKIYDKKVRSDKVDKIIKNVFGDVTYNKLAYKGNTSTCPMGYYDEKTDYYYVGTDCSIGDLSIQTYNYRIIETPSKIDVYQAKAYVKDTDVEHVIYRDETLADKVSADKKYTIDTSNYEIFKKYKFTFIKGSDGLYHFNSLDIVG